MLSGLRLSLSKVSRPTRHRLTHFEDDVLRSDDPIYSVKALKEGG